MKVIIAGGRDFNNYELLKEHCNHLLQYQGEVVIIHGDCKGADKLGDKYADEMGFDKVVFPANWKRSGKSAGHIRNNRMADYADALIAFWDGKSSGTKGMIELAKKNKLKFVIQKYNLD